MSIHIIIDGYNLIRQSHTLKRFDQEDIQIGREALVDRLAAYKKVKGHKITIVFDGADAPLFSDRKDVRKGIKIKFSGPGESADDIIKRMAEGIREKAVVVSSDRDIVNFASSVGAGVITSPEFEEKLSMADYMALKGIHTDDAENRGWKPTTKKKGPRKRLSKKDRRNRVKTRKL